MARFLNRTSSMHPTASAVPAPFSTAQIRSIMVSLMLVILLASLDQTIIAVALPAIASDLQRADLLAWVVSGYLVAMAVATPIYGKVGDLIGRRRTLFFAIGLFLLASVACALALTMQMLVAARILQGLGAGGLFAIAQALIADVVPPRERALYQGYLSATYAFSSVAGPLVGGLLTHSLSWRWVFWINLPIGLVALWMAQRTLGALPVPRVVRAIDRAGALLLCAGLGCLLTGITRVGQGVGWLSIGNLQLFAAAVLLLAIFVWQQRRAAEPILPMNLFRIRVVALCCAAMFITYGLVVTLSVLIPLRAQMSGLSSEAATLQLLLLSLAMPTAAFAGGQLMARTGRFKPSLLAGTALLPIATAAFALTPAAALGVSALFIVLAGWGIGLQFSTGLVAVQNAVPPASIGIATASVAFSRSLGAAIWVAVLTSILLATLGEHGSSAGAGGELMNELIGGALARATGAERIELAALVQQSFRKIFLLAAALSVFAFVAVLLLPNVKVKSSDS
jgi:EmrB/QacA subfamily drug resistance transporter